MTERSDLLITERSDLLITERSDLLIYVQHLLGIGHLRRAERIARAASAAGLRVDLVSGGGPQTLDLGGARFHQLTPALRTADENFSGLVTLEGNAITGAQETARRDQLLALLVRLRPKILLTEMFPFGRRQLRFELMPLLAAAQAMTPRPWIVSSVRDILTAAKDSKKTAWIVQTLRQNYDRVLVHSDPRLVSLQQSFPAAGAVADLLSYTGYITEGLTALERPAPSGEVLVSAGGGAVAEPLVRAALAARALSSLAAFPWRILIGANLPEASFAALRAAAPQGVIVERARPDFLRLLAACHLSISQAGYNTTLEVLAVGARALLVPFSAGSETEQGLRARLLADQGRLVMLEEQGLTGARLAAAIEQALSLPPPAPLELRLKGAEESARLLTQLAAQVPSQRRLS